MDRRKRGQQGEELAVDFLKKKGYRVLERNFRYERGEIDIVAEDREALVFVEVKSRRTRTFGEAEDAVTILKRRRLRRIAEGYLFTHNIESKACRFDVIGIQFDGERADIRHYENAF